MTLEEQIHQNALAIIIESNPKIVRECLQAPESELCGSSREEYQNHRLLEALVKAAKLHRMDAWEYQLKLAEDAGIDVTSVREESRRAHAAALGINDF